MQKTNTRASILIWATFLSLIITVTFIWISTNINKNLKNNSLLNEQFKNQNEIKNIINSWGIDMNYQNIYLDNWEKIIFERTNKKIISLKKEEIHTWKILDADSNINIKILNWWPVSYINTSSSWVVTSIETFWDNTADYFYIKNLWWYTKIMISSDITGNYLSQYRKYSIYKKIWNKEILKTSWKVKNFD
jgi:hypothetical protein